VGSLLQPESSVTTGVCVGCWLGMLRVWSANTHTRSEKVFPTGVSYVGPCLRCMAFGILPQPIQTTLCPMNVLAGQHATHIPVQTSQPVCMPTIPETTQPATQPVCHNRLTTVLSKRVALACKPVPSFINKLTV
jgi:hypothetical protein